VKVTPSEFFVYDTTEAITVCTAALRLKAAAAIKVIALVVVIASSFLL
jgi:hypothetical protein